MTALGGADFGGIPCSLATAVLLEATVLKLARESILFHNTQKEMKTSSS